MTTSRIFTPDLGEKVLKTLARYATLPSEGIVAGQSVTSAIDEVLGTADPVYNDIDIFLGQSQWRANWPEDFERAFAMTLDAKGFPVRSSDYGLLADRVIYEHDVSIDCHDYEECAWLNQRQLYSIEQSRTEGLLNHVRVGWDSSAEYALLRLNPAAQSQTRMDWLVKVFDLNCTQAAVDLRTGKLHVTPQFEQFYHGRQLQVVTGFTPVHSLLRYLKKRAELKVYGDDAAHFDLARRLVQDGQGDAAEVMVRQRAFREGRVGITRKEIQEQREKLSIDCYGDVEEWARAGQGSAIPLSFGTKYLDLYVKHQKMLNETFNLVQHSRRNLWLLTSHYDAKGEKAFEYPMARSCVALRVAEERLAPSKMAQLRQAGFESLVQALPANMNKIVLRRARANAGLAYIEGMEDANQRQRWLDVNVEHPEFFSATVALVFKDQLALMRKVRTAFKKIGMRNPWGTLNNVSCQRAKLLLNDEEAWLKFVDQHSGTLEPLCFKLPLPSMLGEVEVRELTTSRDLIFEGNSQRHCVGGYTGSVASGGCRIVSLAAGESSKERSTIEWRITKDFSESREDNSFQIVFKLNQHQGFANTKPPAQLIAVEEKLRAQLNAWAQENFEEALLILELDKQTKQPRKTVGARFAELAALDDAIPF